MNEIPNEIYGRVVLIGEPKVGKTCILNKYLCDQFQETKSTIGAVFHTHEIETDDKTISLQIWDTAGQEQYRAIGPIYYRDSNAAIAVFDLTERNTMESLSEWIKTYRNFAANPHVVIAANKMDLQEEIIYTREETISFAQSLNAECIWTSALTGVGIDELFDNVTNSLIESRKTPQVRQNVVVIDNGKNQQESQKPKKDKECC